MKRSKRVKYLHNGVDRIHHEVKRGDKGQYLSRTPERYLHCLMKADKLASEGKYEKAMENVEYGTRSFDGGRKFFESNKEPLRQIENRVNRILKKAKKKEYQPIKELEKEGSDIIKFVNKMRKAYGEKEYQNLEHRTINPIVLTAAIAGIATGIFFLSPNITGNAIGNLTNTTSSIMGALLLFVGGLTAAFFLFKR